MFRLNYTLNTVPNRIEFADDTNFEKNGIPDLDFSGNVSDLQLFKWNGSLYAPVDIWNAQYYDLLGRLFRLESGPESGPKKKTENKTTLTLTNVAHSSNMGACFIDTLVVEDTENTDMAFYPLLATLDGLVLSNVSLAGSIAGLSAPFFSALANSGISRLMLSKVMPIEPFFELFEFDLFDFKKSMKNVKKDTPLPKLKNLALEYMTAVPKHIPNTVKEFSLRYAELKPRHTFNTLPTLPLTLTKLDLSQNNIQKLSFVADAISKCILLQELILDNNNFYWTELAFIFRMSQLRCLKKISARDVDCGAKQRKDIILLLDALIHNTALIELELAPIQLRQGEFERLYNRLLVNRNLAESGDVKKALTIRENADGKTFAVDLVARFFGGV
jgi:hypothetical protein